jgi:hypothetical protein
MSQPVVMMKTRRRLLAAAVLPPALAGSRARVAGRYPPLMYSVEQQEEQ